MKKIYLSITMLLAVGASAQFTQTNHAPAIGDTWQTYQCDSLNVSPGTPGTSKTWSFATIATHSSVLLSYTTAAPSNTNYPSANVVAGPSATNNAYYETSASFLKYHGGNVVVSPVVANLTYTTPANFANYPVAFNTPNTAAIGGSINVTSPTSANGVFEGSCTVVADASGTMVLPGAVGVFTNVTRLVTTQIINFTVTLLGPVTGTVTQTGYEYYHAGIKRPIFTIATATSNIPALGAPSSQTIVTRDKNAVGVAPPAPTPTDTGIPMQGTGAGLSVYPNPANTEVYIVSDADGALIDLFDVNGKMIVREKLMGGSLKLDVSGYTRGIYFYRITAENDAIVRSGKLVVAQ